MRLWQWLPLAVALGIVTAACAQAVQAPAEKPAAETPAKAQPKYGGILARVTSGDPPSFDLHAESTALMQQITAANYDQLLVFDPLEEEKIVPDLAERWEVSRDGLTVTFFLRKGVKYHAGGDLTAQDVKFSLDRMRDPPKGMVSPRKLALAAIKEIQTPDDYTVRILLSRPNPSLFPTLAQGWMAIYDKGWLEAGNDPKKEINGTGPFKFKKFTRGTSVELVKNENYWMEGRPYLDGVTMFSIPDANTRLAAFRTGRVPIHGLDANQAREMEQQLAGKITIQRGPSIGWNTMNINSTRKPFDNPKVRQAIMLAIDKEAAIKIFYQGEGDIGGYLPPSSPWALPKEELQKLPGYGPDVGGNVERAKQLLKEAGVTEGMSLLMPFRNISEDLAVFTAEQLAKIGIKTELRAQESTLAYDTITKGDFDLYPWGHGLALTDPDAHYSEFYICGAERNYSRICDKEVDELFLKQSTTTDPAERKKLVWELEKKAIPLGGKIIYGWGRQRTGVWNQVRNYVKHASLYNNEKMRDVWLDK